MQKLPPDPECGVRQHGKKQEGWWCQGKLCS